MHQLDLKPYRHLAAASVYEANDKRGGCGPSIQSIAGQLAMMGPARTVQCWRGDARGLWDAVADMAEGEVLVADMGASIDITAFGGTTALAASARRAAGIVTNGAVRDVAELRSQPLPIFAAGINLFGTQKMHPGRHGGPVVIGQAVVHPGDIVIGDADGVVVVPQTEAASVLERAVKIHERCKEQDWRIVSGEDPRIVLGLKAN